ncbi:MAG TPA: HAD family hydrolase [Fredinandcohnia sp.]|nr:HAD family hydrolase [Fredinandcohnia sp.]
MRFENVVFDRSVLRRVLDAAERHGERGIAVFDLDSTLFDNRPRQVRILREYGRERGIPELAASRLEHWTSAWLVEEAMVAAGLPRERARELHEDFRAFWEPRFFHSDYCGEDAPIPGAVAFVEKLHARGVRIIYCTGRHEGMRPGTVRALRAHAFPAPGEARAALWMKAGPHVADDAFKRGVCVELAAEGLVFALFDNEPTHVNGYREAFPQAHVVHVATDHSGRPVQVHPSIPAVPDFLL